MSSTQDLYSSYTFSDHSRLLFLLKACTIAHNCSLTTRHLVLLTTQLPSIPSVPFQVCSELDIFFLDGILSDMRKEEPRQEAAENAKCRCNEKWILTSPGTIGTTGGVGLNDRKEIGTDECTNLARSGGNTVVLTANGSCGCFRGDEADVVAWPDFAESKENTERV